MKILQIKKRYCTLEILLDNKDFEWASQYNWKYNTQTNKVYRVVIALNPVTNKKSSKQINLHREIMKVNDEQLVIFKDKNTFNCQRNNLQVVNTPNQNPHYTKPDCSNNGAHHHKSRKQFTEGKAIKRTEPDHWTYYNNHNSRVNQYGEIQQRWYMVGNDWKPRWKRPED